MSADAQLNSKFKARIPELDGLRSIAILLVFWHHLVEPYLPLGSSTWLGWIRAGSSLSWSGVDLFFVLSGYFIGGILIDHRDSPRLGRVFYWRRAVRILPLYYITVALILGMVAKHFPDSYQLFPSWVYGLFLTNIAFAWQNTWDWAPFSVLWSIAVEEQFYLAAPWIVRWITPQKLPHFLISLVVLAWIFRAADYYFYPNQHSSIHLLMPMRMDTFALGGLLAWAMRTKAAIPFFQRLQKTWIAWIAAAALLFFLLSVNAVWGIDHIMAYYGYTVLAFVYALLIAVVAGVRPPWLVRLLSLGLPVSIGRYSYFIYLWHMLIAWNIIQWLGGPDFILNSPGKSGIVLLALAATWCAGLCSWKYFEAPLMKLGRRINY